MANNIDIKDATNTTKTIRTVDDGTGKQFNQSIPTDSQGNVAAVTSNGQATRTTDGALVVGLSPNSPVPAGTNFIGAVSTRGKVSIGGTITLGAGTQLIGRVSIADSSIAVTGAGGGSGTITVSVNDTVSTLGVPIMGSDGTTVRRIRTNTSGGLEVDAKQVGTYAVTQSGPWSISTALTSTNNNVALTSVGTNPIAVGTGAAATAIRVAFSPNVDKTLVGMVSIGDSNVPVAQSGVWNVNAALTSTNNNVALTSVGTSPVAVGTGAAATALRVAVAPNTDKTVIGAVSLADTTITINALPAGTNIIGKVSLAGLINGSVSISNIADVSVQDNAAVSVRGGVLGSVSLGGGSAAIGKLVANTDKLVIGAVSIADTILGTIGIKAGSAIIGSVSLAGINPVSVAGVVTVTPFTNTGAAVPTAAFFVGGTDGTNVQALKLDSTGTQRIAGYMSTPVYSFTTSAGTRNYAANQLVANSGTAANVNPLSWPVSRFAAGTAQSFSIRRARIKASKTTTHRGHNFRLHLWNKGSNSAAANANVSVASGDNAAFSATKAGYYVGAIDVSCDYLFSDGSSGVGSPNKGTEINIVTSGTGQVSISGYLEALTSLASPASEVYTVILEMFQD